MNSIQMPKETAEIVNERSHVWVDYDNLQKQVVKLNELARKIDGSSPADAIDNLTDLQTPPAEVMQSISALQKEIQNIENAQNEIQRTENEIQRIKSRLMMIYIGGGAAIVIIGFLVVSSLFG